MAKSRLAMVMCDRSHVTGYTRSNGLEKGYILRGLGQGDSVKLEVVLLSGETQTFSLHEGTAPLDPTEWFMYRLIKEAVPGSPPTEVEILLR